MTGRIVSTEPAIISSVSCTCSPTRLASATGSVYFALVAQDDQRPHEVVPRAEEGEGREGDQDRLDHRHDDRAEDPELPGSVDPRGVQQLVGDPQDVLADHEDPEHARQVRNDDADIGVHESHLPQEKEEREHPDLGRDDQREHEERKIRSRPPKRSFAKAYPAIPLIRTERTVAATVMTALFRKCRARFSRVKSAT